MLPLFFSTARLSMFVQYRIFAAVILLSCEMGVSNVLYGGNSGWMILRTNISSASGHLEKQRTAASGTEWQSASKNPSAGKTWCSCGLS